jgi:hypothetical protein
MSNSDFFSLFSEDEPSSESLTSLFDVERVPSSLAEGEVQQNLESLEDIFKQRDVELGHSKSEPLKNIQRLMEVVAHQQQLDQMLAAQREALDALQEKFHWAIYYSDLPPREDPVLQRARSLSRDSRRGRDRDRGYGYIR